MLYSDLLWLKNKKNPWRISGSPVIAAQSVLKPRPYLFFVSKRIALFPDVIAFPKEWSEQYGMKLPQHYIFYFLQIKRMEQA